MKKILLSLLPFLFVACASSDKSDKFNIDREGIRKTFFSHSKEIRGCYGKILDDPKEKNPKGKMVLDFDIDDQGKAHDVKLDDAKSSLKNPILFNCLKGLVGQWTFPKAPDGIKVNVIYPMAFASTPSKKMQERMDQFKNLKNGKEDTPKK